MFNLINLTDAFITEADQFDVVKTPNGILNKNELINLLNECVKFNGVIFLFVEDNITLEFVKYNLIDAGLVVSIYPLCTHEEAYGIQVQLAY